MSPTKPHGQQQKSIANTERYTVLRDGSTGMDLGGGRTEFPPFMVTWKEKQSRSLLVYPGPWNS